MISPTDLSFLKKTISLAKKGLGYTKTNPLVGAILAKNKRILATGYHAYFGGPHAEIKALAQLKSLKLAKGATLYINLEPCCHYGKTPPCTNALIQAGIKRVICAINDPNPKVNGNGIAALSNSGIEVHTNQLSDSAKRLNEVYFHNIKQKRPFVILKAALSLDGKIATRNGDSQWISSESSRQLVHRWRSQVDACLAGVNTVLKDDCHLGVRLVNGRDPLRIIIDPNFRVPISAKVFRDPNCLVVTHPLSQQSSLIKEKAAQLINLGIEILEQKTIDLHQLLQILYKKNIASIMIEGGAATYSTFLEKNLIDKFHFFIAPIIIGGQESLSPFSGCGADSVQQSLHLKNLTVKKIVSDLLISAYPHKNLLV